MSIQMQETLVQSDRDKLVGRPSEHPSAKPAPRQQHGSEGACSVGRPTKYPNTRDTSLVLSDFRVGI